MSTMLPFLGSSSSPGPSSCTVGPGRQRPHGLKSEERPNEPRSEEHTSELQSPDHLVCRLLLEKQNKQPQPPASPRRQTRLHRPAYSLQQCALPSDSAAQRPTHGLPLHHRVPPYNSPDATHLLS